FDRRRDGTCVKSRTAPSHGATRLPRLSRPISLDHGQHPGESGTDNARPAPQNARVSRVGTSPMIVLAHVSKSYDGGARFAVHDVSLCVPQGQTLVLLGGSGSGKTTTLKMINRLIEPTSGTITIDGQDVRDLDPVQLRRGIGYVFQGIGLFPHLTVAGNIGVVPRLLGWPSGRIDKRIDEFLELVHLPPAEYRNRLPRDLAGGQQQRVGFARALAAGSRVMLLDEPFGALDPVTRDELRSEFLELRRRLGLTAVMVTHDMTEALLSADLVAVMNAGQLVQVGTPHHLPPRPPPPYVADLMSTPKKEAHQLETLATGNGPGEPHV